MITSEQIQKKTKDIETDKNFNTEKFNEVFYNIKSKRKFTKVMLALESGVDPLIIHRLFRGEQFGLSIGRLRRLEKVLDLNKGDLLL